MPGCGTWSGWICRPRLPQHGPDSVQSWLVAGACAMSSFFAMSGWRSIGFLYVAILDTFQVTRTEASWPVVLIGALACLTGFITGPLAHTFYARPVIIAGAAIASIGLMACFFATTIVFMTITLGVVYAIGTGMVFIVAPTVISEHFVRNKGLALGLNFAGVTAGLFVFPKLLEYLTGTYGLRGALLLFGAISMNGFAFSLYTHTPYWRKAGPDHNEVAGDLAPKAGEAERKQTLRNAFTVFRSPMFYLILYSFNTYCMSYDSYMSLFVDFASDRGVMVSTAVTVMAAGAIAEGLGRFALPIAVDRGLFTNNVALTITLGAQALAFLLLPFLRAHGLIFATAIGIIFTTGTAMVLFPVAVESYFGHEKMSVAFGVVVASSGLQSFVKPPLIGHFRDKAGAYDWIFLICGLLNVIAVAVWIGVIAWETRRKNRKVVHHEHVPIY